MDFESDFLISPGDVYPNRQVKLEDAEISEETKKKFEEMCDHHPEAFSKNNKDIGRTTLIEMEIDMGDSLPVTQNPYTLPLKHHEWVIKEIETLEKAGVIERPWASPVIVVPKKSAPDEPPRRCLCVDYKKIVARSQMDRQRDWMLELISATEDRRDVCKIEWSQVLLNHRPQEWILPHWINLRIQGEICICGPDGEVGI